MDETMRHYNPGRIMAGVIILAIGVLMLLDRSGAIDIHLGRMVAPFVLIALGLARIADGGSRYSARRGRRVSFMGVWLVMLGCWMLISELHVLGMTYRTSWPLLLVGWGTIMVLREIVWRRGDALPGDSGQER